VRGGAIIQLKTACDPPISAAAMTSPAVSRLPVWWQQRRARAVQALVAGPGLQAARSAGSQLPLLELARIRRDCRPVARRSRRPPWEGNALGISRLPPGEGLGSHPRSGPIWVGRAPWLPAKRPPGRAAGEWFAAGGRRRRRRARGE